MEFEELLPAADASWPCDGHTPVLPICTPAASMPIIAGHAHAQ
jgi:hypothetical protein